jgi:hypothetical protein
VPTSGIARINQEEGARILQVPARSELAECEAQRLNDEGIAADWNRHLLSSSSIVSPDIGSIAPGAGGGSNSSTAVPYSTDATLYVATAEATNHARESDVQQDHTTLSNTCIAQSSSEVIVTIDQNSNDISDDPLTVVAEGVEGRNELLMAAAAAEIDAACSGGRDDAKDVHEIADPGDSEDIANFYDAQEGTLALEGGGAYELVTVVRGTEQLAIQLEDPFRQQRGVASNEYEAVASTTAIVTAPSSSGTTPTAPTGNTNDGGSGNEDATVIGSTHSSMRETAATAAGPVSEASSPSADVNTPTASATAAASALEGAANSMNMNTTSISVTGNGNDMGALRPMDMHMSDEEGDATAGPEEEVLIPSSEEQPATGPPSAPAAQVLGDAEVDVPVSVFPVSLGLHGNEDDEVTRIYPNGSRDAGTGFRAFSESGVDSPSSSSRFSGSEDISSGRSSGGCSINSGY